MRIILYCSHTFFKPSKDFLGFLKINQFASARKTTIDLIVRKWAVIGMSQMTSLANGNVSSHIKNTVNMN